MHISRKVFNRACIIALSLAIALSVGPKEADAQIPVSLITSALPTVAKIIQSVFSGAKAKPNNPQKTNISQITTQAHTAAVQLQNALKGEQLIAEVVSAAGDASIYAAIMLQEVSSKTALTDEDLAVLRDQWLNVTAPLDAIAKAKPDTSLLANDVYAQIAVNAIVKDDQVAKQQIGNALNTYKPSAHDSNVIYKNLSSALGRLNKDFATLNAVTAIELGNLASSLVEVANAQAASPNKVPITADQSAKALFKGSYDPKLFNGLSSKTRMALQMNIRSTVGKS